MKDISRRKFLKGMGVAGGMLIVGEQLLNLHSHALAAHAARDRLRVAIAGLGDQGQVLLEGFLKVAGVDVVALCDIDDDALNKARARIDFISFHASPEMCSRRQANSRRSDGRRNCNSNTEPLARFDGSLGVPSG